MNCLPLATVPTRRRIGDSYITFIYGGGTLMALDRAYQRELLQKLAVSYPQPHDVRQLMANVVDDETERRYAANLVYLEEHGLAESAIQFGIDGHMSCGMPRITAKGMDFLADDGGLSAILGVVTIKIHEDSLRALLLAHIEKIPESDPEERSSLSSTIRSLPGRAVQLIADRLLAMGVQHLPIEMHSLHTWITQVESSTHGLIS